jgi:hypothetical protein
LATNLTHRPWTKLKRRPIVCRNSDVNPGEYRHKKRHEQTKSGIEQAGMGAGS